jgi:hypothetical protein
MDGHEVEFPCERCGETPAVMIERNINPGGHPVFQRAIVCGGCIMEQYIEWTEGEE